MRTRILQFGTSRFLQAHADLFIHEAREARQARALHQRFGSEVIATTDFALDDLAHHEAVRASG